MNCIFCKIVDGTLPSYKVYEDGDVLAFLDVGPVNYGHTLIVPKKHVTNIEEADDAILAKLMSVAKKVGKSLKDNLGIEGYNFMENNDPIAGQVVPHLHFHLIPRTKNDGLELWPQGKYGDGEAEEILKKIKIK